MSHFGNIIISIYGSRKNFETIFFTRQFIPSHFLLNFSVLGLFTVEKSIFRWEPIFHIFQSFQYIIEHDRTKFNSQTKTGKKKYIYTNDCMLLHATNTLPLLRKSLYYRSFTGLCPI